MTDELHRAFKDGLYAQLARIGKALASAHRLELLELLAQGERSVEELASETAMSMASTSQHLQVLKGAQLVSSRKEGVFVRYALADDAVSGLTRSLRSVAELRLAELERVVLQHFGDRSQPEPVSLAELLERAGSGRTVILDIRPSLEYRSGHIRGALCLPLEELQQRLEQLPKQRDYVAYCRGPYCIYADRAVELLLASGRRARRLREGFPEWKAAGYPIETGTAAA